MVDLSYKMAFARNKRICLPILNTSAKDDTPSILLVGDIGEDLEKMATELIWESDLYHNTINVHTANKLPISGKQVRCIISTVPNPLTSKFWFICMWYNVA